MSAEVKKHSLDVAVVRFPGSNCDDDTLRFFNKAGHNPYYLWHKDTQLLKVTNLMVLCGGFAFGDRKYTKATGRYTMDPGAQALESPVMDVVYQWAKDGRPILGICNGFQILVHAGLLPGKLEQNSQRKFFCDDIDLAVDGRSFFNSPKMLGNVYRIGVAHGYGRYRISYPEYRRLVKNKQVFLRYQGLNPNGSTQNIAGVCNREGTNFGMMPHPERIVDPESKRTFMEAIENYVRQ